MARDKLTEYSATASENTVCGDVNIAENSALPSDMNNFAREVMSHLKNFSDGTDAIDALEVTGDLTVDTNTLHVDAANNRVGIGTVSPDKMLTLEANNNATGGSPNNVLRFKDSDTATVSSQPAGAIEWHTADTDNSGPGVVGKIQAVAEGTGASYNLQFHCGNVGNFNERLRILSGGGLTFNGDTAGANALDDYEEGTWTPTVSVGTINHTGSRYVKIGQMVTVMSNVHSVSNRTAGDHFSISGLPYDIHNTATGATGIMGRYVNNGGDGIVLYLPLDASRMDLYTTLKGSNYTGIGHNDLNSASANFFFSVTYITDQ